MRITFSIIVSLLFFNISWCQEPKFCGLSDDAGEDSKVSKLISELPVSRSRDIVNIEASIHILRKNGIAPIEYSAIYDELLSINEMFLPTGHQLVSCKPYYIDDNNYNFITIGDDSQEFHEKYGVPGTVNIYFVDNIIDYCGFSSLPWFSIENQKLFVDNACLHRGTFAHEIGHFFGLYHTHSTTNGSELVNGNNCETAGDLLCDTPADPRLNESNVNINCVYTGNDQDLNFQYYEPETENLMSYSRHTCREQFSSGQLARMEFYMRESGLFLDDCGGIDLSLKLADDFHIDFGESKIVALELNNSSPDETIQTEVKIYIKSSVNAKNELLSFHVTLDPKERLFIEKGIALPNFYEGGINSLIFEIDPNFEIVELDKANNRQEVFITNNESSIEERVFFPIPSNDQVTVLFKNVISSEPVRVEIYNHLGEFVISEEGLENGGAEYYYSLNISEFPSGVYFARFRWPNKSIDILRFVKI